MSESKPELEIKELSDKLDMLQHSHNRLQREFNQLLVNLGKVATKRPISTTAKPNHEIDSEPQDTIEVQQFWQVVEKIGIDKLNHSKKPKEEIALRLKEVFAKAKENNHLLPSKKTLIPLLKESKKYKFESHNEVRASKLEGKSVRCWIFSNK